MTSTTAEGWEDDLIAALSLATHLGRIRWHRRHPGTFSTNLARWQAELQSSRLQITTVPFAHDTGHVVTTVSAERGATTAQVTALAALYRSAGDHQEPTPPPPELVDVVTHLRERIAQP